MEPIRHARILIAAECLFGNECLDGSVALITGAARGIGAAAAGVPTVPRKPKWSRVA